MSYNASVKFQYVNDSDPSSSKIYREMLDQQTITMEAPAQDMNVWQYYEMFKGFLRAIGFQEHSILEGACSLAFNDSNDQEIMKKLMKEYELQDAQVYSDDDYYALQKDYEELKKSTLKDDCMPPWGHSDMEALRYTDEELNAMCDAAENQESCKEMTTRELEWADNKKTLTHDEMIAKGYEMTGDGFWIPKDTMKVTTNNPMMAWNGLVPGSDESVRKGCKCPVMDNAEMPEDRKWVNGDCPLHGKAK